MSRIQERHFEYHIIEKKLVTNSPHLHLYSKAYEFWKNSWRDILEKAQCLHVFQVEDFYRQDKISVITYKGDVVAIMLHTFFDMKNPVVPDMRYFSIFNEWAMQNVRKHASPTAMTMEYLLVHPDWRKGDSQFSLADVLAGLAFQVMKSEGAGICLGVAIKAAKVDEIAHRLQCQILAQDVKRGNFVCDIVSQTPAHIVPHPDLNTEIFTQALWHKRYYTHSIIPNKPLEKVA